jgi:hypothetical protein
MWPPGSTTTCMADRQRQAVHKALCPTPQSTRCPGPAGARTALPTSGVAAHHGKVTRTPPSLPSNLARRRIPKVIGIAGVIALIVNFSGLLPSPHDGWLNEMAGAPSDWLAPVLLVGALVWIALLLGGIAFIAWAAFRGITWLLRRRENP